MTKMNHAAKLIISFLGLVLLILVVGAVVMAYQGKPFPDKLIDMAMTCVVGMFALLGRTGADSPAPLPREPQP